LGFDIDSPLFAPFGIGRYSPFLIRKARQLGAEIVHSHFGLNGWRDSPSVRRVPAARVVSFYGYDVNKLPVVDPVWRDRYQEMFTTADRVLCEGPFMANSIASLGCPPEIIRVHHLGVEVCDIPFAPRSWQPGTPLRDLKPNFVLYSGKCRQQDWRLVLLPLMGTPKEELLWSSLKWPQAECRSSARAIATFLQWWWKVARDSSATSAISMNSKITCDG
jgi:hypothetical protein